MEWDFTLSQLFKGEVDYTLKDFLHDFQIEVDTNFPDYDQQQRKALCSLFYGVMYFNFNGHAHQEIAKIFKIDTEFVEIIVNNNKTNIEMLGTVIMNIYLKNIRETKGLLSEEQNLELVNAELREFHKLNKL